MEEKHKLLGNFEKILKFFDENSIEKLNFLLFLFYYFFKNSLLKIELSEITPFFYNIFFCFGGREFAPSPIALPLVGIFSETGNSLSKSSATCRPAVTDNFAEIQ